MDPCSFDNLFSKNVLHVLEKIFISLDYKSYKKCLKVNNEWNRVLTSQSFRMKGKHVFHREILKDTLLLYHAAKEGDRVSVQKLLSTRMVDVNIPTRLRTPLLVAAQGGHQDIVKILFDHGADLNKSNFLVGLTAVHFAAVNDEFDTVRLLLALGADPQLTKVYARGKYDVAKVLLLAGANPNVKDENGEFPLLLAVSNGRKSKFNVSFLLQKGANPNIVDQYGYSPLHYAAREHRCQLGCGCVDVIKQLLDGGADPNCTTIWGETPLHIAVECQSCKEDQVVKMLLERGADKTIADEKGRTPLTIAHGRKALSINRDSITIEEAIQLFNGEKKKRIIIKALTD